MSRIPSIERKPRTAAETAIHYGYCAFKEIELGGPCGLDHNVQPPDSPFYRKLPARQLIPFTNVEFKVIDEKATKLVNGVPRTSWMTFNKFAKECVQEMADSYASWGFKMVDPLTGYSDQDAESILDAIQPFDYKIVDLLPALERAEERINATEPYTVEYGGETRTIQPLPEELKDVAFQVLGVIAESADIANNFANETKQKTFISMTKAFAGGEGKTVPDPHDKYVYDQLGDKPPTIFNKDEKKGDDALTVLANALATKSNGDSETAARLAEKEKELDAKLKSFDEKLAKVDALLEKKAKA